MTNDDECSGEAVDDDVEGEGDDRPPMAREVRRRMAGGQQQPWPPVRPRRHRRLNRSDPGPSGP